jgi:hypothetical protein
VNRVIATRRKGDDYSHSHMSRILRGEDLCREDFESRPFGMNENTCEELFVGQNLHSINICLTSMDIFLFFLPTQHQKLVPQISNLPTRI